MEGLIFGLLRYPLYRSKELGFTTGASVRTNNSSASAQQRSSSIISPSSRFTVLTERRVPGPPRIFAAGWWALFLPSMYFAPFLLSDRVTE